MALDYPGSDAIHTEMLDRLMQAGRRSNLALGEALLFREFYSSVARRNRMSVAEFLARYPLPLVRSVVAGPDASEQAAAAVERSPAFLAWAGSANVIDFESLDPEDFTDLSEPIVMKLYHGSTHSFEEFDAQGKGHRDGFLGAVNYFTTSYKDARDNYLGNGPDLRKRIQVRAEKLAAEAEDDRDEDHFLALAEAQLAGEDEKVYEVYVRSERPFVIGSRRHFIDGAHDLYDAQIREEIAGENGFTADDPEVDWDVYDDDYWERLADYEEPIAAAFRVVADRYDVDLSDALSEVTDRCGFTGVTHAEFFNCLMNSEVLAHVETYDEARPFESSLISSHIIAEIIGELGFDAIILPTPKSQFPNVHCPEGTMHVHIPHKFAANIKSLENRGTFDPASRNIYYQRAFHGTPAVFDRFDPNFNKSGEGANSYGYGFYFASNEKVAHIYRKALTAREPEILINGRRVVGHPLNTLLRDLADKTDKAAISAEDLRVHIVGKLEDRDEYGGRYAAAIRKERLAALRKLERAKSVTIRWDGSLGHVMTAEVPDDELLLNLDVPPCDQPYVVSAALRRFAETVDDAEGVTGATTGLLAYKAISQALGSDEAASAWLNANGVLGARYADAFSREPEAGSRSHNIVVYDAASVQILPATSAAEQLAQLISPALCAKIAASMTGSDHFLEAGGWGYCAALQEALASAGVAGVATTHTISGSPALRVGGLLLDASGIRHMIGGYVEIPSFEQGAVPGIMDGAEFEYDRSVARRVISEGRRAADFDGLRGSIELGGKHPVLNLYEGSDGTTVIHESAHLFLSILMDLERSGAEHATRSMKTVREWWELNAMDIAEQGRALTGREILAEDVVGFCRGKLKRGSSYYDPVMEAVQEYFARGFEKYLAMQTAPSPGLRSVFEQAKRWVLRVYDRLKNLRVELNDEIKEVFDSLVVSPVAEECGNDQRELDGYSALP